MEALHSSAAHSFSCLEIFLAAFQKMDRLAFPIPMPLAFWVPDPLSYPVVAMSHLLEKLPFLFHPVWPAAFLMYPKYSVFLTSMYFREKLVLLNFD